MAGIPGSDHGMLGGYSRRAPSSMAVLFVTFPLGASHPNPNPKGLLRTGPRSSITSMGAISTDCGLGGNPRRNCAPHPLEPSQAEKQEKALGSG